MRDAIASTTRAVRARPSFGLYLLALALFPWKWLSPLGWLSDRAGWIDVFVAAATVAWAIEKARARTSVRLRAPHYAVGAYLFAGALSVVFASADRTVGLESLVVMAELVMLFVLTSDYASSPTGRDAIVLVVLAVSFVTIAQTALALGLFYADVHTSLVGTYGPYLSPSDLYARVAAGFYSPPLLGSFCIFASAVLAREDSGIKDSARRAAQLGLAAVVVLTFSRAIIGFAAAAIIRAASRRGSQRAAIVAGVLTLACVALMAALTAGRLHGDPTRPGSLAYQAGDTAGNGRFQVAKTSLRTFSDHPLLGTGPGSLTGKWRGDQQRAHLTPLNVAATVGAPALAALALLVVALWRGRRRPTDIATWSGLAGLGIDGLGQDVDHFRHVWVMLGLADADRTNARGTAASRAPRRRA